MEEVWQRHWQRLCDPRPSQSRWAAWLRWLGIIACWVALAHSLTRWWRGADIALLAFATLSLLFWAIADLLPRTQWRLIGLLHLADGACFVGMVGAMVWIVVQTSRS